MEIITKEEAKLRLTDIGSRVFKGEVFIYPTDTIYGIGCDATKPDAVKKVQAIKPRHNIPYSVIAPSIEWIRENCEITPEAEEYLDQLPGPLTLILKLKNKNCIAKEVNFDKDTLGVRIPDHWIKDFVNTIGTPIITTSVNKTGDPYMTSLDDLDEEIQAHISFCIYEEEKKGNASKIIHLEGEETKVRER